MSARIVLCAVVGTVALAGLGFLFARPAAPSALPTSARSAEATRAQSLTLSKRSVVPAKRAVEAVPPSVLPPRIEEGAFMRDLRVLSEMDAELAIERAREGEALFGATADAPERRSILIHALSHLGRASEARGEAESMVNDCPDSSWVREVERLTGAHRHRNLRLAANGELEYW